MSTSFEEDHVSTIWRKQLATKMTNLVVVLVVKSKPPYYKGQTMASLHKNILKTQFFPRSYLTIMTSTLWYNFAYTAVRSIHCDKKRWPLYNWPYSNSLQTLVYLITTKKMFYMWLTRGLYMDNGCPFMSTLIFLQSHFLIFFPMEDVFCTQRTIVVRISCHLFFCGGLVWRWFCVFLFFLLYLPCFTYAVYVKLLNDGCQGNALRALICIGGHFMGRLVVEFVF